MPTIAHCEFVIRRLKGNEMEILIPGHSRKVVPFKVNDTITLTVPIDITLGGALAFSDSDLMVKADEPRAK